MVQQGIRRGRGGARVIAFMVVGGLTLAAAIGMIREFAVDFTTAGLMSVLSIPLGLGGATIFLLSTGRADAWFHRGESAKLNDFGTADAGRPRELLVAVVMLGAIATIQVVFVLRVLAVESLPDTVQSRTSPKPCRCY